MGALISVYLLLALGLIFCFVGKFPGQILAYAGMLVAAFAIKNHFYPTWLLILCGVLVIVSIIINKVFAPKLANKVHEFGKAGRMGTIFGSILSLFMIAELSNEYVILSIFIISPYLLAFLFELISQKKVGEAAKRAAGAYTLFAVTTFINLAICVFCAGQVLFGWIGNGPIEKGFMNSKHFSEEQSNNSGSSYIYSILRPDTYYYEEENISSLESRDESKSSLEAVDDEMSSQKDEIEALKAELEAIKAQMKDNNNVRRVTYVGKIDNKYEITMLLNFYGNTVEGSYYYGSGENGSLNLSGQVEINLETHLDKLTLQETTSSGKITGEFVGTLDGLSYYGTFTNLSTDETYEFSVDI